MTRLLCVIVIALAANGFTSEAPPVYPPNAALHYWRAISLMSVLSAEEHQLCNQGFNAPSNEKRTAITEHLVQTIDCLHHGAKIRSADWGTDIKNEGPVALMPHLGKCRELARAALVVAREHFDKGRPRDGLNVVFDVLALARHTGCDHTLIGKLVDIAIGNMAMDAISQELPKLPREELEKLDLRIAALPADASYVDTMKSERMILSWIDERLNDPKGRMALQGLGGDDEFKKLILEPEKMHAEIKKVAMLYDEAEKLMTVSYAEMPTVRKALEEHIELAGALAKQILPVIERTRETMDRSNLQMEMTLAAIQVVLNGETALQKSRDPYGDGPFTFNKLPNGFELQSKLTQDGKPVKHAFGEAARKAPPHLPDAVIPPAPPPDEKPGEF